jgi:hypothetical protein
MYITKMYGTINIKIITVLSKVSFDTTDSGIVFSNSGSVRRIVQNLISELFPNEILSG